MRGVVARVVALGLLVAAAVVGPASVASACSCLWSSPDEAFAKASVVFRGQLVEQVEVADGDSRDLVAIFDIDTVFKGSIHQRDVVLRSESPCAAGPFFAGQQFVFGSAQDASDAPITIAVCSDPAVDPAAASAYWTVIDAVAGPSPRMVAFDDAKIHADSAGQPSETRPEDARWAAVGVGAGLVVAAAGFGLLIHRLRRHR